MAEPKSFPVIEQVLAAYAIDVQECHNREARAELEAARELLAAAIKAETWIADVTNIEDGVAYVNGKYDGFVDIVQQQLRVAIAACQPGKELG